MPPSTGAATPTPRTTRVHTHAHTSHAHSLTPHLPQSALRPGEPSPRPTCPMFPPSVPKKPLAPGAAMSLPAWLCAPNPPPTPHPITSPASSEQTGISRGPQSLPVSPPPAGTGPGPPETWLLCNLPPWGVLSSLPPQDWGRGFPPSSSLSQQAPVPPASLQPLIQNASLHCDILLGVPPPGPRHLLPALSPTPRWFLEKPTSTRTSLPTPLLSLLTSSCRPPCPWGPRQGHAQAPPLLPAPSLRLIPSGAQDHVPVISSLPCVLTSLLSQWGHIIGRPWRWTESRKAQRREHEKGLECVLCLHVYV